MKNNKEVAPLDVKIPVVLTRDTVQGLVAQLFGGFRTRPKRVRLDFMALEKIQVGGVTVLCNMIALCRQMGLDVEQVGAEFCDAWEFVEQSGLLAFSEDGWGQPPTTKQFLPIRLVRYDRSHAHVHFELIPWLAVNLGHDDRALATLRVCFEEIFNNIRDHSAREVGCSAAHFNEKTGEITICVADFGIGIPGRVRSKYPDILSDHAAIARACVEGFSTHTTPRNMGYGLFVLVRNVVERNGGTVDIVSGEGAYLCTPGARRGLSKRTGRAAKAVYPGTMIRVVLEVKKFIPDEVEKEEFKWD